LWFKGKQAQGDIDVGSHKLRHRVQLHPQEAFPPEIHGCHPYCFAIIKMPRPKDVITIKADQRDALACENTSLSHGSQFGEKSAQEQAIKAAKIKGDNTPSKILAPKPHIGG
jgi:hypothetical protein